jgi:hypothetical protein
MNDEGALLGPVAVSGADRRCGKALGGLEKQGGAHEGAWIFERRVGMNDVYEGYYPPLSVLIVLIALWISLAVGNGFIARALGKHVALWVGLSLIPVVNSFFYIYILYSVVLGILDKLNMIQKRMGAFDT